MTESPHVSALEFQRFTGRNEFRFRGEKKYDNSIEFTLHMADLCGKVRNIHFTFYLDADTALSIAGEMVELDLANEDVVFIAELIDRLIIKLLPNWKPSSGWSSGVESSFVDSAVIKYDQISVSCVRDSTLVGVSDGAVEQHFLSQLAKVENHGTEDSVQISAKPIEKSASDANHYRVLRSADYIQCLKECDSNGYEGSVGESSNMSADTKNSGISFTSSCDALSNDFSLSISSLPLTNNNDTAHCHELKLKLNAIEMQYHQYCHELLKMSEEAEENAKKRWIAKRMSVV
ncbi:unnamed protein product [Ilex paraguariensis]|uniref:non-specific serine/threonine protein kinase n=1 Tax=Ilex paraguariensis TaxID=185542 RepID=A0ABC8TNC2_9AQUA